MDPGNELSGAEKEQYVTKIGRRERIWGVSLMRYAESEAVTDIGSFRIVWKLHFQPEVIGGYDINNLTNESFTNQFLFNRQIRDS
jgi:hypothetical protein